MTTTFAPNCSLVVNNAGGNVETLSDMRVGGKVRAWIERITLASQALSTFIMVARLPVGAVPLAINLETDTSLSASTLAVGDYHNNSLYAAAATLTSTNTPTNVINAATRGLPITSGYDYLGNVSTAYEDVLLTIGTSNLPNSGNLVVIIEYVDYSA